MLKQIFSLILFLHLGHICLASDIAFSSVKVSDKEDYSLQNQIFFFEDKGYEDYKSAYQSFKNGLFGNLGSTNLFNKGYSNSKWWFALNLENELYEDNTIIFSPAGSSLMKATLYIINKEGKLLTSKITGYHLGEDQRSLESRLNALTVTLKPREKVTLLLETDSRGRSTYLPFFLDSPDSFWAFEVNRSALFGGISTVLTFASLFSLILFYFLRERVYVVFTAYIMACLLLILEEDGYAYDWFYGENFFQISLIGVPFFSLISSAFLLRFNLLFFESNLENNNLYRQILNLYFFCLIWSLLLIFSLWLEEFYSLKFVLNWSAQFLGIFCLFFVMLINIIQLQKRTSIFIMFLNLLLVFGFLFYFSNNLGFTSWNPFNPNGLVIGVLINIMGFSFLMGYRFYLARRERESLIRKLAENEKLYLQQINLVQEEERHRIARDLHDDLGGLMAMIKLKVEDAENKLQNINGNVRQGLQDTVKLLEKASHNIRFIAHELLPKEIEQKTLKELISDLVELIGKQDKLKITFNSGDLPELSNYVKSNLFRIIKELLNNIIKHAKATEAEIEVFFDDDDQELKLIISDDGKGFEYLKIQTENKGMGFKNLNTRLKYLGGKVEVNSGPLGTTIVICVPTVEVK